MQKYLEQLTSLNTAEGWEASWNLTVDLGVIQSQLFGLYGKIAPLDNEESKNQLIYYLADLSDTLPIQLAIASRTLLGKYIYSLDIMKMPFSNAYMSWIATYPHWTHRLLIILKVRKLFGEDIKTILAIPEAATFIQFCCVKSTLWLPSLILKPEEKWKPQKLKTS